MHDDAQRAHLVAAICEVAEETGVAASGATIAEVRAAFASGGAGKKKGSGG